MPGPSLPSPFAAFEVLASQVLTPTLLAYAGAVVLFVVVLGGSLVAMYFLESNFRIAVNVALYGTPDRSGQLARRSGRPGRWRSGWYRDESGAWKMFDADGEDGWAAEADYYARRRNYMRSRSRGD